MNAALRKGWCPSLMMPMASGDGLLVRVKPPAGRLTASKAEAVAEAARLHGNGFIDLTNRGNLQIRGLSDTSVEGFAKAMLNLGLAVPDPAAEAARTVLVDPLGADDPTASGDSHALGLAIEALIVETPELHELPGKFGFLVDAGKLLPTFGVGVDIAIRAVGGVWRISLDGCASSARLETSAVTDAVYRLASIFLARANERAVPARRMREITADGGGQRLLESAGLVSDDAPRSPLPNETPPVGFLAHDHAETGAFVVAAPFGQLQSQELVALARMAEAFGDGTLRLTCWRALVLPSVDRDRAGELAAKATELGMLVDAGDPRRLVSACPGRPACPAASVDTRADAARLAALDIAGVGAIHVSGCAKGCAHPRPAPFTLVGNDGSYDLVRNGTADALPDHQGLGIADIVDRLRREDAL